MKIYRKIMIGVFASIILFVNSVQGIKADNTESYTNENGSVIVNVEKVRRKKDYDLIMSVHYVEDISDVRIESPQSIITPTNDSFKTTIHKNGEYTFEVSYIRTVKNNEPDINDGIQREENFTFNVTLDDLEEDLNKKTNDTDGDSSDIKIEVKVDEQGHKTINKIPEIDDLDKYIGMEEMVYVDKETDTISIIKNEYMVSKKSDTYGSNVVTMGNKVIQAGDTVTVTWRENRSYYWVLWGGISELFVNGNRAYCLEPSILERVATGSAYSTNLSSIEGVRVHPDGRLAFKPTSLQKRNIELIANYGYHYPGHNSMKYEWATKKLIWNEMGWDVEGGPNVDKETKEIQFLINNHNTKPSFDGSTMKVKLGQVIDLSEAILDQFKVNNELTKGLEILESNGKILKVKIVEDKANLVLDKITGSKKGTSLVYTDGTSQKVAHLKIADPISAGVNFVAEKHKQRVKKIGVDGKPLPGHIFRMSPNNKVDNHGVLVEGVDVTTNQQGYSEYVEFNEMDKTIYVQEILAIKPYIRDLTIKSFVVESGKVDTLSFTNKKAMGQIKIIKVDSSGDKTIKGAIFEILDSNHNVIEKLTTNANGEALSSHLDLGSYLVKEVFVPEPYIVDDKPIEFKLDYKDQSTPLILKVHTHKNKVALGQIEIFKKSNHGDVIEGVVFEILDSNNTLVETLTTNKEGKAYSSRLALGLYHVRELKTVNGFVFDPKVHTVELKYSNQLTPVVVSSLSLTNNHQRGNLKLHKVENDWDTIFKDNNGKALSGARIQLFAKSSIYEGTKLIYPPNYLVDTQESDENGNLEFKNLPVGSYYAKEIESPKGYILFDGVWNITIHYDADNPEIGITNIEMEVSNQVIYGKANLIKTNGSNKLLEGAKFGVFTSEGEKVVELISDQRGMIESPNLRYGTYYLQEIEAPVGFWLDTEKLYFEISEHEAIHYLTKSNNLIEAKIKVKKIDSETSQPLSGVGFKILDSNSQMVEIKYQNGSDVVVKSEWFTNDEGIFILEAGLPYGEYKLIETVSVPGYKPIEPISFTIDENQKYVHIDVIGSVLDLGEIVNHKKYSDLVIKKIDESTGLPLSNTHFDIFDSRLTLITSVVTDLEGIAELEHLPYGMYYIVEKEVPFPYVIIEDEKMQTVFIEEDSKVYELVFSNITTSVNISKINSENGDPIEGAVFKLLDSSKRLIASGTTDKEGKLSFEGILPAPYFIEEVYVPYPFKIGPQDLFEVTISKENNHPELIIENNKVKGNLEIIKKDSKTSKPLSGVKFGLYKVNDISADDMGSLKYEVLKALEPTLIGISDEHGSIIFENLDIESKWVLIELESLYGYDIDETIYNIEFEYDTCFEPTIKIKKELYNKRSKVLIKAIKMNKYSNLQVSSKDLKLILKDSQGQAIETLFVDNEGVHYWEVDALELYYLSELIAPKGYLLSDEVMTIDTSIQTEQDVYTVEYFNIPETKILVGIKEKPPIELIPDIPDSLPATGLDNNSICLSLFLILMGLLFILVQPSNNNIDGDTVINRTRMKIKKSLRRICVIKIRVYSKNSIICSKQKPLGRNITRGT